MTGHVCLHLVIQITELASWNFSIHRSLVESPTEVRSVLEGYAHELTNYPIPAMSLQRFNLILEYELRDISIYLYPQDEFSNDVFDLDLSYLFSKFSLDYLLYIMLAILCESKVLFITKQIGLLTPVIHVSLVQLFVSLILTRSLISQLLLPIIYQLD